LPVKNFVPIKAPWLEELKENLQLEEVESFSTDVKYLLAICKAVDSGECSETLANTKPGRLHHARWVTLSNCVPRLHVATERPSENLLRIVTFIMTVYAPVFFFLH